MQFASEKSRLCLMPSLKHFNIEFFQNVFGVVNDILGMAWIRNFRVRNMWSKKLEVQVVVSKTTAP